MKKKNLKITNGITVCDSILMSVKKKYANLRQLEAVFIALTGYISTIMVFLSTFDFNFNQIYFIMSAFVFSAVYISLSLIKKITIPAIFATAIAGGVVLMKNADKIALGYKFIYNVIYMDSYHTKIEYYKFLDKFNEKTCVTTFLIMAAWLLAIIIFVFTIYHPHPIPPIITVFSLIEIGMYNGLEINIFWGMMVISYIIAVFAVSTTDMGEYSGGNGGFVRNKNIFFPKRQMRLKVTEKCGVILIILVMTVTGITAEVIKLSGYKRSEDLNQKRIEIKEAVESFSFEDFADSVSDLTVAFGLTFKIDTQKLGNIASMKYKDKTDMTVTIDKKFSGELYLKGFTGSIYEDNEWSPLPDSEYNSPIFADFATYSIYPQDFPHQFNKIIYGNDSDYTISFKSSLKGERSFAPYGTDSIDGLEYNHDSDITSKVRGKKEFSYKFSKVDTDSIIHMLSLPKTYTYSIDNNDSSMQESHLVDYCEKNDISGNDGYIISVNSELPVKMDIMYEQPQLILAELIQDNYKSFVYDNYLQLPNDTNMEEIREEFADIISKADNAATATDKINVLYELRTKVAEIAEYSLSPGKTPKNRDFVNYFLLENHKGYCTHFASAGVILARMAGIPARYATGYVITENDFNSKTKNSDGSYSIDVKDNRRHAWVEIYLDGYGWVPLEFTAGFTNLSADIAPTTSTETNIEDTTTTTTEEAFSETDVTENETIQQSSAIINSSNVFDVTKSVTTDGAIPVETQTADKTHISGPVKYTIYSILTIITVVLFVLLRRKIILKIRYKRFSKGEISKRASYIYAYAEKLLEFEKIYRKKEMYSDFSKYIEKYYGGKYFAKGEFAELTDISLRAAFSDLPPDEKQMKKIMHSALGAADNIYNNKSIYGKLYMKFIACLV